jgi:acetaldehyde dehydrogenase (acetylating)
VLIAELSGVGRDFPLSIEKLCPVLSFYVVKDWREGCERCKQILRYGGMGHTMSIHSRNDDVILQFGLKKPAFRIVVNTPAPCSRPVSRAETLAASSSTNVPLSQTVAITCLVGC